MEKKILKLHVGDQEWTFETGKIGRHANGAVLLRCGETIVFSTACASPKASEEIDFLPLRVDYLEHFSSAGKTLSGFIKRQGKPSEREVLMSRLIDRPLRPMFEEGYYNETQVLSYVWSYDGINATEPLAICCASAALVISDIPLIKPIAGVRVGFIDNKFVVNPTVEQQKNSKLDLLMAGTEDAVLMIEGYCDFLTEEQVGNAIATGHEVIRKICHGLQEWRDTVGKPKNRKHLRVIPPELHEEVAKIASPHIVSALRIQKKQEREDALTQVDEIVNSALLPKDAEPKYRNVDVQSALKQLKSNMMRHMIVTEKKRSDGRGLKDIRVIDIEQTLLPRAHGSSLFTRGETQSMAVCTLGGTQMGQRFEDLHGEGTHSFYLQYFFPPYSVGEVGRMGAPGRREVGHGKLAERALRAILPSATEFPYTIRLESNITESNGSSSMASVCGGCLSMMDAGVPIKRPVSGIAMGLILEETNYVVLSDILGIEDSLGDMDFKVTGDAEGITAFQMDIKVEGITIEIMRTALLQAKEGLIHILKKMLEVCPKHKDTLSDHAPRIESIKIKPSKIGIVIGPGGKQIRKIVEETGVEVDITDEGIVNLSARDFASIDKAKKIILGLVAEVEVGQIYEGKVTSLTTFGAFVEILPGKEGLCHISEWSPARVANMTDCAKVGDQVSVIVLEINTERNQIRLSRKALLK